MGRWIRKRPFQDLKKVLNRLLRIGTGKRWLEGRGIWDIGLLQYGWPLQQEERLLPDTGLEKEKRLTGDLYFFTGN